MTLKDVRKKTGLSQAEFAKTLGSKMFAKKPAFPRLNLQKL